MRLENTIQSTIFVLEDGGMAALGQKMGGRAKSAMKPVGGIKDGLGRLLPTRSSSFNDIKMWYRSDRDPAIHHADQVIVPGPQLDGALS
jgi:hypothetical protein